MPSHIYGKTYKVSIFSLLQLEELPPAIGLLRNLEVLNLCNNLLTSLPSEIGRLTILQTLNLALNKLETLPRSITALQELRCISLSDNRFTRFPGCLKKLKKLESVNLDGNPIVIKAPSSDSAVRVEQFHKVKKSFLCENCKKKCEEEKKRLEDTTRYKVPKLWRRTKL